MFKKRFENDLTMCKSWIDSQITIFCWYFGNKILYYIFRLFSHYLKWFNLTSSSKIWNWMKIETEYEDRNSHDSFQWYHFVRHWFVQQNWWSNLLDPIWPTENVAKKFKICGGVHNHSFENVKICWKLQKKFAESICTIRPKSLHSRYSNNRSSETPSVLYIRHVSK